MPGALYAYWFLWGCVGVQAVLLCGLYLRLRAARRECGQKARELQEARRHEALGTLAGGIAHDFNNILGSIMGFGALLEDDLIAHPEQREMARQVSIAARRGQGIVTQLMNYSKKNRKRASAGHAPFSLDALIRENVTLIRPSIRSSTRISYENHATADTMTGDATQIGQALVNLCINADHAIGVKTGIIGITLDAASIGAEYADADDLRVSGGTRPGEPVEVINGSIGPGAYLRVTVTDNGEGMTRDVAARIFDPFFTTKDVNVGTGLGLAAIQGIVRGHGGAITVKTEKFKGTAFTLMLPAGIPAQGAAGPPAERASR